MAKKNGESNRNIPKREKRPEIEHEKRPEIECEERPAHAGPARGVRIHLINFVFFGRFPSPFITT